MLKYDIRLKKYALVYRKVLKMDYKNMVKSFISTASEGEYWDFKQEWYKNNADLLKDIICMANNTTIDMKDGYIIFGIEDKTYNIIGVGDDSNRKNTENIIGFLSSQIWSGEEVPNISVTTVEVDGKEIDILTIKNSDKTLYYLLKDYSKCNSDKKEKVVVKAGVIYSRIGDRNTSSAECATKGATEFLWKKRFGLVGNDKLKVIKRLENIENWYSVDEFNTLYNYSYNDIKIKIDDSYELRVEIDENKPETNTWVMDFPYLFASACNWNIGSNEIGQRRKWDIFLNGRQLEISLYGVRGTRQEYFHIEPDNYIFELAGKIWNLPCYNMYYAYIENSVNYLAYKLFFSMQCYHMDQRNEEAFKVIPVFNSENEHKEFIEYIKRNIEKFESDVDSMDVNEMFPLYAKNAKSVVVYKLCKTMVQWLAEWRKNGNKNY